MRKFKNIPKLIELRWEYISINPLLSTISVIIIGLFTAIITFLTRFAATGVAQFFDFVPFISGISSVVVTTSLHNRAVLNAQEKKFQAVIKEQKAAVTEISDSFGNERRRFEEDFGKLSKKLAQMARRSKTFQIVGQSKIAIPELVERISNAQSVQNTFVGLSDLYTGAGGDPLKILSA